MNSMKKILFTACSLFSVAVFITCTMIEFPTEEIVIVPPEIGPKITLCGPNPYYLNIGDTYEEPGALAYDSTDGDLTASLYIDKTSGDITTNVEQEHTVLYAVRNSKDEADTVIRTVIVQESVAGDYSKPVITLLGDNPTLVEIGDTYSDAGATAEDEKDGDISSEIETFGTNINTIKLDTFAVWYMVLDNARNVAYKTREVYVVNSTDRTPPVIELEGPNPINLQVGNAYNEYGATATDNIDGDLTDEIEIDASEVNTDVIGSYKVYYRVTDEAGNQAEKIRDVNVSAIPDTDPPVITLLGFNPDTHVVNEPYEDAGATAQDNFDGDISDSIIVTGTVDIATYGSYTLRYNISDKAGNAAEEKTRTVIVADTVRPVITINKPNPVNIQVGNAYNETGATAVDNVDGDLTHLLDTNATEVNVGVPGVYNVYYTVPDVAGNMGIGIRVVNVLGEPDTVKPVITLQGSSTMTVIVGNTFTDPGYTATDDKDGDITSAVVVTGSVDANTIGTYTLRYNVSDQGGNAADEKIRTVNVTNEPDTEKPVITLKGDNPIELNVGDSFTDPGCTAVDNVDGDITDQVAVTGSVDTDTPGSYTLRYNVSDQAGNAADEKTRTVNVLGTGPYPEWSYSKRVTLNTASGGAGVSGNVSDFPVLIRLTSSNFTFSQAQDDGGDIRFAKSDETHLPYEIEQWDRSGQQAAIWVLVDEVRGNNSSQYITMHWGNSGASDSSNGAAVFATSNDFAGVWHLGEDGNTSANGYRDATSNAAHARGISMTASSDVTGMIGRAQDFEGDNTQYLEVSNESAFDFTSSVSLSAWIQMESSTIDYGTVVSKGDYTWRMGRRGDTDSLHFGLNTRGDSAYIDAAGELNTGTWYHVVAVYNGSSSALYVNGTSIGNRSASVTITENDAIVFIGNNSEKPTRPWDGLIDEVRISSSGRNGNWIKLCYENQRENQRLVTIQK